MQNITQSHFILFVDVLKNKYVYLYVFVFPSSEHVFLYCPLTVQINDNPHF